jgi:hypothetical protein
MTLKFWSNSFLIDLGNNLGRQLGYKKNISHILVRDLVYIYTGDGFTESMDIKVGGTIHM